MTASRETQKDLSFHLRKIQDSQVRALYRDAYKYAESAFDELELTFSSDYVYFRRDGSWFARLYAQKTKMAIDVKGDYPEYPTLSSLRKGSKFSQGDVINFHVEAESLKDDVHKLVDTAWNRAVRKG